MNSLSYEIKYNELCESFSAQSKEYLSLQLKLKACENCLQKKFFKTR